MSASVYTFILLLALVTVVSFGVGLWLFIRLRNFNRALSGMKEALTSAQSSEEQFRSRYDLLVKNIAAGIMLHEADGTVLWSSPFTEVITGFSTEEINASKNSFFAAQLHEEDREIFLRALAITLSGEPFQCRYRFYHRSGTMLWLETRSVPLYDEGLEGNIALSMTLDVTAQVQNQLYVEDRNRDLQDFTYMISHDLKAPIFTIRGMLGIVEEDTKGVDGLSTLPFGVTEALTYIAKATNRLEQLVKGVLQLANVSVTDQGYQSIDLTSVLDEVKNDYDVQLKVVGGSLMIAPSLPHVLGDATKLYQVFANLFSNAVKYRTDQRALQVVVSVEPSISSRRVRVTVSDTARGISEEKIGLLFKPFQRIGEQNVEGTGVGLACVARLLEKMGGSIKIASDPNIGSTFTIELRAAGN